MKLVNVKNPVMASWLREQGFRLDVPPFLSGVIEARKLLEQLPVEKEPLASLTQGEPGIFHAGRIKRNWVIDQEYGVPFLSSTDILQADLSRLSLISRRVVTENPQLTIRKDWSLITRSGSIGRMAYARPDMDGLACSEDVLRVVPHPEQILPGYLYAFLSSKFGVPLVVGGTYGAIIQHIEPHHVASLPVPRLGEELEARVHMLMERAAYLLGIFQANIVKATENVFERTGVHNLTPLEWLQDSSDLWFYVRCSEIKVLRVWNHSRRAERIKQEIKAGRWSLLGDLTDAEWLRWRMMFKRIDADPEFGIEVITQRPLFQLFPEGRWISRSYLLNHSPRYIVPTKRFSLLNKAHLVRMSCIAGANSLLGDAR
jgi:hypothetical protein